MCILVSEAEAKPEIICNKIFQVSFKLCEHVLIEGKICYLNEFRKWLMMVGEIANSIVNMASCRTSTIISSSRPGRRVVNNIVT